MRPRVLHLLNSRHFNGAENVAATLMIGLRERWDGLFVSRDGPVEESLRLREIPFRGVSGLKYSEVRRVVDVFEPDVIHAHDYRASLIAAAMDRPVVSHLHNNYPWARRLGPVTLAYRMALPRLSRVIAVSPSVIDEHRFRRAISEKGIVIENGLDFERIQQSSFGGAPPTDLVFIGRLTEQKDPLSFIHIVKALQRPEKQVTAVMLGDGDLREACEKTVEELGLQDVVRIAGYVWNPYPTIASSKICLVPSRWEGFGLVALEALALGALPLGRPVGGLGQILRQISPDLGCDSNQAFVEIARSFLVDDKRRHELVCAAQSVLLDRYSMSRFADQIEGVYRDVISR